MEDQAYEILVGEGVEAALTFLKNTDPPLAALNAFDAVARKVYNEQKDVALAVRLWQAGTKYGEENAKGDLESLYALKGLYYNLAANTWPGWEDEGIEITAELLIIGQAAAETNLKMAIDLERGDLPISRGYWMVGAHQLASAEYVSARENFAHSAQWAHRADAGGEIFLAQGFIEVANLLEKPERTQAREGLEKLRSQVLTLEHGDFFAGQWDAALRVFGG